MSIFIDQSTTVVVQGITGRDGSFHAKQMMEYGTRIVGGVTPGKGGQHFEGKVPIFNTVVDAVRETGAKLQVVDLATLLSEAVERKRMKDASAPSGPAGHLPA